jgi:hypothetical protein
LAPSRLTALHGGEYSEDDMPRNNPELRSAKVRRGGARADTANLRAPTATLDRDEIARLAYSFWEARGCNSGSPEEDWFRAEKELRAKRTGSGA